MKKSILLILMVLLGITRMSAQVEFISIEPPTDGSSVSYTLTTRGVNYLKLEATETGTVEFHVGWSGILYYSDAEGTLDGSMLSSDSDSDGKIYKATVESGNTYYFRTHILVEDWTITVNYSDDDGAIKITSNYEDGDLFDLTGENLQLTFDRILSIDRAIVYVNGDYDNAIEIPSSYISYVQTYYYVMLRNLVEYLMDRNEIQVGDSFTISLEGISDANDSETTYGDDGTYSITLTLDEMPVTLESVSPADGSTIYTYYPPEGDDGFITFTFSDDLNEDTDGVTATASWGDIEGDSYEIYYLPFTISGNVVTVDMRGIIIPETVTGSRGTTTTATTVTVSISGLTASDGRSVDPNYSGLGTNSILAFYSVKQNTVSFIYEFIPSSGTNLSSGTTSISIWSSVQITYDDATVEYINARGQSSTITIAADEAPFEYDEDEEGYMATLSLAKVPETSRTNPLYITLNNAKVTLTAQSVTIVGEWNTAAAEPASVESVVPVPYNVSGEYNEEIPSVVTITMNSSDFTVSNATLSYTGATREAADYTVDGNVITVQISEAAQQANSMSVMVYATGNNDAPIAYGTSEDDGSFILLTYQMPRNAFVPTTVTPAAGAVESLSTITLGFDETVGTLNTGNTITLTDAANNVTECSIDYDAADWNVAIISVGGEITAEGTYTLTIPEGTIYNDSYDSGFTDEDGMPEGDLYNPELVYVYSITTTGITSVKADADGNVKVYTVNGVYVGEGPAAQTVNSLPAGVYIVNGTKMVIK